MRYIDDDDEALSQIRKNKNLRGKKKRKRKRKKNSRALHAFLYSVSKVKRRTTFHSRDLVRTVGGFQIVLKMDKHDGYLSLVTRTVFFCWAKYRRLKVGSEK